MTCPSRRGRRWKFWSSKCSRGSLFYSTKSRSLSPCRAWPPSGAAWQTPLWGWARNPSLVAARRSRARGIFLLGFTVSSSQEFFLWNQTPLSFLIHLCYLKRLRSMWSLHFFFKNIFKMYSWLCWVFVAALGLSLVAVSRGDSLVAVYRLLTAVASLVAEHEL